MALYVVASMASRPTLFNAASYAVEEEDSLLKDSTDSLRTIPTKGYTILPDTTQQDTVQQDTTPRSKSALEEPVEYSASDSITFDYEHSRANLFGSSKVNYQNLELDAELIAMSIDSSLVHASGLPDSTGKVKGKPTFKQGEDEYEPDKISYNFKSRKAYITNVYTEQGEGFMMSQDGKRDSSGVMYVQHAKYTTCQSKKPHFYIALLARAVERIVIVEVADII